MPVIQPNAISTNLKNKELAVEILKAYYTKETSVPLSADEVVEDFETIFKAIAKS